jgi:hypothetical protein
MVAASGRHAARLVFQSAGVLIADSACSRIRVLHCYRVYRSPGYVPSTGAGEQSASFSVWANWRRDFPVPAAMSGLGQRSAHRAGGLWWLCPAVARRGADLAATAIGQRRSSSCR